MKRKHLLKSMLLLCALIAGSSVAWADTYTKITSASDLEVDAEYLLVSGTQAYSGVSSNIGQHVTVTFTEDNITGISTAHVLKLGGSTGAWTFYDKTDNKYIAYTSSATSKSNYLHQVAEVDNTAKWTLTVSTSAVQMQNNNNTGRWMRYNSDRFCCYYNSGSESTTGSAVTLYKKVVDELAETTTVTIDYSGITNNNLFLGTSAGILTASVNLKSDESAIEGAAVTWSSSNTSVATINETTGVVTLVSEGTATLTASYAGVKNVYKSSSDSYELTVVNDNPNTVTLWSEDFQSYSSSDVPTGGTYGYVCQNGTSDTKIYADNLAGGSSPELLVGKSTGYFQATIPLDNIQGSLKLKYKTNAKSMTISTSTDGISISGSATYNTAGEHTITFTGVTSEMTSITIKFTPAGDNVRLDDIVLKGSQIAPVTITDAEYATYCNAKNALDFSETGITVYTATDNEKSVTLNEVTSGKIPANTPVVLYKAGADGSAINVPVITSADAPAGTNDLHVSDGITAGSDRYVLAKKTKGVGFYPWTGGALSEGKIYLQAKASYGGAAEFLPFDVDGNNDQTTGISAIEHSTLNIEHSEVYNLSGQRVSQPTKGLYIVNGKKVIIK